MSTFNQVEYVRAPGPNEARELAATRFRICTAEDVHLSSPFVDPDLVHCVEVDDTSFSVLQTPSVLTEQEAVLIAPLCSNTSEAVPSLSDTA